VTVERIVSFYTRYFVLWIICCGVAAYYIPRPFVALKGYMDLFFGLTMFGIGAVLKAEDFKKVIMSPGIICVGVISQFTIMPVGALVVSRLFRLPPELTLGLILTGSAPGAMASNVMSYLAGADVAYSVSLTATSTLFAPVMTPGLTYLLAKSILKINFFAMFFGVIKMVIIPLAMGFWMRHSFKRQVEKISVVFPAASATFIIFICALVIALNRDYLPMMTWGVLGAVIALNLFGMSAGYAVGTVFRFHERRRRTLGIEVGMQNAGLGTVLALKYFGERVAIPAALFVFVCLISGSIMAEVWKRRIVS